ncbi:MAG: DegT/DnrJ/EryC1/StrS family aminotransferase [Nitrospirae bacterium]|nr:MAG: DegT/DnrJ/EryC1/StrS family aminotransferase [Nitrospirota bacterium]
MSRPADIPHSRPSLVEADAQAVGDVIRTGLIAQGERVAEFERALAKLVGQGQGVAVSSGTAALFLALKSLDVGPGAEVVIPSYSCTALWHAVKQAGATPVLADIDPATYNLSPAAVLRAITPRTKAVIVVHSFGLPMDVADLKVKEIPLIEDCAQTLGVSVSGNPVGSRGDLAVCSFYATKLLTAGEGGMVLGRSAMLLSRIRAFRQYDEQDTLTPAFNYKMTDLQAAIGLSQAKRFEAFLERRRAIARRYAEAVRKAGGEPPQVPDGYEHAYYRFVVRMPTSVGPMLQRARALGIACRRPVYRPIHRYLGLAGFPESDTAWEHTLSIPIYPALSDGEVNRVVKAVPSILVG